MTVNLISSTKLNGFSMTFLAEGETSTPGWSSLPEVRGAWPNKKGFKILKHFLYGCYVQFTAVLWIRIHIDLALLDPDLDPFWECGSGSRSKEIDQS